MTIQEKDQHYIWHPYTQMKNALPHIPIVKAEGVYLHAEDGKKYIDAVSSWWVNIHGHSHPYIAERVSAQLHELAHVIFAGFTHKPAVTIAEGILKLLPNPALSKVFFSDNGSTAIEVALKMCLQYWNNHQKIKTKIVAFKDAYHGDTFGAMSISGRSIFTQPFQDLLFEVVFLDLPCEENFEDLKTYFEANANDIACFIFEPLVQGTAGMRMYEPKFLDELLSVCTTNEVLTIADEVFTGFGRTGKAFAMEHCEHQADIYCLSKGLTGGTMPMGLTVCTEKIFQAFYSDDKTKTLYHGHSYTANPVACAAAIASLELFLQPQTMENINRITAEHQIFAAHIASHPNVKTIRQCGTILALEWNTETHYLSDIRNVLYNYFLEQGILLRPLGNIVYILPPYIIQNEELHYIYQTIEKALNEIK